MIGSRGIRTPWLRFGAAALLAGPAAATVLAQVQQVRPDAPVPPVQTAALKGGQVLEERAPLPPAVQEMLGQINAFRAAGATCGSRAFEPAAPLAWSEALERAADAHAKDMATRRQMSHTGSDGSSVGQRAERAGYGWWSIGENVSAGYKSAADALAGWMKSPGHCSNIMSPGFSEVGVAGAYAAGDTFGWYRAMVLGRPRSAR